VARVDNKIDTSKLMKECLVLFWISLNRRQAPGKDLTPSDAAEQLKEDRAVLVAIVFDNVV